MPPTYMLQGLGRDSPAPEPGKSALSTRPELSPKVVEIFRAVVARTDDLDVFRRQIARTDANRNQADFETKRLCLCNYYKDVGNSFFKQSDYDAAIRQYTLALRTIFGDDAELPSKEVCPLMYEERGWREYMDAALLCNNLALCYLKIKPQNVEMALRWGSEVESLYIVQQPDRHLPWINEHLLHTEFFTTRMKMLARRAHLFLDLGNTGHATSDAWAVQRIALESIFSSPKIEQIKSEADIRTFSSFRHPNPTDRDKLKVTHPGLQIRGSWKRLKHRGTGPSPAGRCFHSAFIWRNRLYIGGGQRGLTRAEIFLADFWYLPLVEGGKWHRLPDIPTDYNPAMFSARCMRVWKDVGYVFMGSQYMWGFNLKTEKWSQVLSFLDSGKWPYGRDIVDTFSMHIYKGTLYAFGGVDGEKPIGCNIFMSLDLATRQWTHIGGSNRVEAAIGMPALRQHAGSWVVEEQEKLYILFGGANRTAAHLDGLPGGDPMDHTYDDFWSYSFSKKEWKRESLLGNSPSRRTEHSTLFNDHLGHAIVYGGYSPAAPLHSANSGARPEVFGFSYYSDTFIWNPKTNQWAQVLTRSFPTYRAQGQLLANEATGKMYMFGGYTNSSFVPAKTPEHHNFGDVWELAVDLPGGHWEESEWNSTLRLGPWTMCYGCKSVGQWQKCGGTCNGQVHFCSKDCLKDRWSEHKAAEGCVKRK